MPRPPPAKDSSGNTVPHDCTRIPTGSSVVRRISHFHVVDGKNGRRRLSSALMQPSTDPYRGLSVDVEVFAQEDGVDLTSLIASRGFVGAVAIPVAAFRELNLLVGCDPVPDNQCHGQAWPDASRDGKITGSGKTRLLRRASWFWEIADTDILE